MDAVDAGLLLLLVVCEGDGKRKKMIWGLGEMKGWRANPTKGLSVKRIYWALRITA